jgi:hypothetical protein
MIVTEPKISKNGIKPSSVGIKPLPISLSEVISKNDANTAKQEKWWQ